MSPLQQLRGNVNNNNKLLSRLSLKIVKGKYMQSEQISHLRYRGKEGKTVFVNSNHNLTEELYQIRYLEFRMGKEIYGQKSLHSPCSPSQWLAELLC